MNEEAGQLAGRREWIGLAVLALPCLLISMDASVLNLAVAHVSADLEPSSAELLWIVDIYAFLLAGLLIVMGAVGDRIGRRRLLMTGAAAFGAASVLAAFANSSEMLIAARALLGVAAATLMPSTLSLIRTMFQDGRQRTAAIGVWVASLSIGGALGPLAGGALLELFWWGSVFLIAVPVMALLLVLAPLLLPESRDPNGGPLDLLSAALSLAAVLLVVYGLKHAAHDGFDATTALTIAAGALLGAAFLHRQTKLRHPLIDIRLFRAPAFSVSLATNLLGFLVVFGVGLFMAQYLQLVLGLSPIEAGLWTVPTFAGFLIGATVTPVVVRAVSPGRVMSAGLLLAGGGFAVLAQASGLTGIVVGSVVFSLGLAPVFTLVTDMVVGSAPPARSGAAAAIAETSTELGAALGFAVLGSIGTAVYRSRLDLPAAVPADATEAARDTLGGAVEASDRLSESVGAELVASAEQAFTDALHATSAISAAVVIALAVVVAAVVRRPEPQPASAAA